MLYPVRVECGLGCPPDIFTTNASESVNAVLKRKLDYKQSELPQFIDKVKEVIAEQQREVERAIINRGKYRFREQYKYLEISEMKWFAMNSEQRKKHLQQLQNVQVSDSFNTSSFPSKSTSQECTPQTPPLSMSVEDASEQVNIPLNCLEGVWAKANELVNTSNAIVPAPGQDPEARMVLSYSGKLPIWLHQPKEDSHATQIVQTGRRWEFVRIQWQLLKSTKNCNNSYLARRRRKVLTSPNC